MSQRFLINRFSEWIQANEPIALVTVIATEGSTYSKAGRHLLIRASGEHAGLVSGGCLEGDLADHARDVMDSGVSQLLTYDMRDDADDIWGMGVGCNGLIEVLLQKLSPASDWAPFRDLANAIASPESCIATLVTQSDDPEIAAGSLCIRTLSGAMLSGAELPAPTGTLPFLAVTDTIRMIHWRIDPWPRLLVLGAGPDAEPVCNMALDLGWQVCVADHRAALIESAGFGRADQALLIEADHLATTVDLDEFSACIIMSHHLETDQTYLQQLAGHFRLDDDKYLGVLGPAARRSKLLAELKDPPPGFAALLRGPVGLDIGADSPESIALSVISEIHAVHKKRAGGSLHKHSGSKPFN